MYILMTNIICKYYCQNNNHVNNVNNKMYSIKSKFGYCLSGNEIDYCFIEHVFILTYKKTLTCRRLIVTIHSVCNK